MGQLQVLEGKNLLEQKPYLKSERITINHDNEVIYVDKVPTGLKGAVFLYDIQQPTKKLHNPAFIINLTALNLFSQRLLMRKRNENPGPQEHAQHPPLGRE